MTFRSLVAAPFLIVAAIAYLLMGLQLVLAVMNLLSGATLLDALSGWILGTAFFGIVGSVVGVIGMLIGGNAPFTVKTPSEIPGPPGADDESPAVPKGARPTDLPIAETGDQVLLRIDTMLPVRSAGGWQFLPVSKGDIGIVVATSVEDWESTVSAERVGGGQTVGSDDAIAVRLHGRMFVVPVPMIRAGQVRIQRLRR